MRRVALVVPTETTPFVAEGATFVRKELPACAVVVEPAPNATELRTLAFAFLPIATVLLAEVALVVPSAILSTVLAATLASTPKAIDLSALVAV